MSTLIAFTTITLDGGENSIDISIEAANSNIPPGGSTELYVYTSPDSYLSSVGVEVTDGSVSSGGIEIGRVEKEVVTLTRTDVNNYATGNLSRVPASTPSYTVISTMGGSSSVSFSGTQVIANDLNVDAIVLEVSYDFKYKKYNFTAPNSTSIPAIVAKGFINV